MTRSAQTTLSRQDAAVRYVGFFDVLGFGRAVLDGFDAALKTYNTLVERAALDDMLVKRESASYRILSDAILVTSGRLGDVVAAANNLQFAALGGTDCLRRGGIGRGLHVERQEKDHLFVVSEAFTRAVDVEKTVRHPCIALDATILPHPSGWAPYETNILRPLLFYEHRWLVNPLNVFWGVSAGQRVQNLKEARPEFSDKYDWFLKFHRLIMEGPALIPSPEEWKAAGGPVVNGLPEGGET